MADNKQIMDRYLCFSLGAERFAIPLLQVREVIAPPATTPVPQAPAYCVGYMNLRGEIITVLDLRKKFGIKGADGPELSVVICRLGNAYVGLTVDSINLVLSPAAADISAKPEGAGGKLAESITGVYREAQGLVLFLDLAAALADLPFSALTAANPSVAA